MPTLLFAAVPLRWTVETSRVQPASFDAYHGETLSFEATLQSYGKPHSTGFNDYKIYWQTNGMEDVYWSAPATCQDNVVTARFTPEMDTGANVVRGFLGCAGEDFRAAFQLRLRPSPGATPNMLTVPPAILDLSKTVVINAPWPTDETIKDVVREVVDEAGIQAGVDEDEVEGIVAATVTKDYVEELGVDATGILWGEISLDAGLSEMAEFDSRLDEDLQYHLNDTDNPHALTPEQIGAAPESVVGIARDALAYASGVYNYMHADENAWFSGTNYVFGTDAATRHKFAFEPGMDLGTVPCSMALVEKRDGVNQTVWDQRDWTSWYWAFKAGQMQSKINATYDAIRAEIEARAPAAWSQRTAATGLANPDSTTTWIDTKTITLSPGMAWETVATVDGCGYWTVVGNGVTIGGSGTNAVLEIKDFEGNRVITVKKGSSALVSVDKSQNIDGGWFDSDGRICFSFLSDIQPIGEYSTYLEDGGCFVDESDESCPVESEWEKIGDKIHRVHFKLKNGIIARSCFARFKVWKKGDTEIELNGTQKISGGLIYNGTKIAPVIPAGAKVGDTITWKVVE